MQRAGKQICHMQGVYSAAEVGQGRAAAFAAVGGPLTPASRGIVQGVWVQESCCCSAKHLQPPVRLV